MSYQEEFQASIDDPEKFWADKAQQIDWFKQPQNILSTDEHGIQRWFADGELNTSHLALDYHVENDRGDQLSAHLRFTRHRSKENVYLPRITRRSRQMRGHVETSWRRER